MLKSAPRSWLSQTKLKQPSQQKQPNPILPLRILRSPLDTRRIPRGCSAPLSSLFLLLPLQLPSLITPIVQTLALSLSPPMASSISLSSLSLSSPAISGSESTRRSLRFCGLRKEAPGFQPLKPSSGSLRIRSAQRSVKKTISASTSANGTASASGSLDYDLVIIGAGVGGHGAALHAVEKVKRLFFFLNLSVIRTAERYGFVLL